MLHQIWNVCALVGGVLLLLQIVIVLLGHGHHDADSFGDHDGLTGHPHDGDVFVKVFTFKSITAFLTFFGLAGLACEREQVTEVNSVAIATFAGVLAIAAVASIMGELAKLQSRGNLRLENAIGMAGKVHVPVPAANDGIGKVIVEVQGRTIEAKAVTRGAAIATGLPVKVIALRDPDLLEVMPLADVAS